MKADIAQRYFSIWRFFIPCVKIGGGLEHIRNNTLLKYIKLWIYRYVKQLSRSAIVVCGGTAALRPAAGACRTNTIQPFVLPYLLRFVAFLKTENASYVFNQLTYNNFSPTSYCHARRPGYNNIKCRRRQDSSSSSWYKNKCLFFASQAA